MLRRTNMFRTELVEMHFWVSRDNVAKVQRIMAPYATILEDEVPENGCEVLPEFSPGAILAGFRAREELTQLQLARRIGISRSNLSAMENGKRPIGKEMAKRLAAALETDYRIFL